MPLGTAVPTAKNFVKVVASTVLNLDAAELVGFTEQEGSDEWGMDLLGEFAGRICYLSFDRPNPATAANKDYLANIIKIGHESVLEHSSATLFVQCSRSVLTELERHRHLSFSVVSQRYVDLNDLGLHIPPGLKETFQEAGAERDRLYEWAEDTSDLYNDLVEHLEGQGLPRKQAREAARAVVPNSMSSPMLVTGNLRAWRHVIKLRTDPSADAEIQEVAGMILAELKQLAPNSFQDM